jgi:hypothetical protein
VEALLPGYGHLEAPGAAEIREKRMRRERERFEAFQKALARRRGAGS